MTLSQLYYFEKAARLQHISKAAKALCITQPSLSISLSNLEKELGVPLLKKEGRNILLTEEGKAFLEYTDRILADVSEAKETMSRITKAKKTHIRLGYIAPLGHKFIPQTIRDFLDDVQKSNISFTLESESTQGMAEKLKQDYFDLGFCSEIRNEPELVQIPMIEQPVVLIVPNCHVLAKYREVSLARIKSYPLITYHKSSPMRELIREMLRQAGLEPKISCDAPDEATIASLVSAGFGIALVARVDELLETADVHIVTLSDASFSRKIYLTYRRHRKLSEAVSQLLKYYFQLAIKPSGSHDANAYSISSPSGAQSTPSAD